MVSHTRVALVTGANGDIGSAIATALVEEGFSVWGVDRDEQGRPGFPDGARYLRCDLGEPDSVREACATIVKNSGSLDVVLNSASELASVGPFALSEPSTWESDLSSLRYAMVVTRYALPFLLRGKLPRVVMIGSLSARGTRNMAVYSGAKAAIEAFSASLAQELGSSGVTVNTVSPGPVEGARQQARTESERNQRLSAIPMGRFAEPRDVADAVRFLVSPEAGYISGQNLVVSGGAPIAF